MENIEMTTETVEMEEEVVEVKKGLQEATLDEILFPVVITETKMKSNSEYSRQVVGRIDGENFLLNVCSPRYELVRNKNIFPKIEEVLRTNGIEFGVTYKHINNVRFYADYVITDERFEHTITGTDDKIQPKLMVQHSYNGLTKYKIAFGYFRLVCSNGLVIPVEEMEEYNLSIVGKHTASINNSFIQLDEMLKYFVDNGEQVVLDTTLKFEALAENVYTGGTAILDVKERIEEVLKASKITALDTKGFNTVNSIFNGIVDELKEPEMSAYENEMNDWLIYNGINRYIHDDDLNIMMPEVRFEKDRKVLEAILS